MCVFCVLEYRTHSLTLVLVMCSAAILRFPSYCQVLISTSPLKYHHRWLDCYWRWKICIITNKQFTCNTRFFTCTLLFLSLFLLLLSLFFFLLLLLIMFLLCCCFVVAVVVMFLSLSLLLSSSKECSRLKITLSLTPERGQKSQNACVQETEIWESHYQSWYFWKVSS
jgi:hypothetical protein